MLAGATLGVVAIAEDFLRNFPDSESQSRRNLINACKTNPEDAVSAFKLYELVNYLFNMYPYAELEDDDTKMFALRNALRTNVGM